MTGCAERLKTYTWSLESVATPATSPWLNPDGICSQPGTSSKVIARSPSAICSGSPFATRLRRLCRRHRRALECGHHLVDEHAERVQRTVDRHVAEQWSEDDVLDAGPVDQLRNLIAHLARRSDVRLVIRDFLVEVRSEGRRRCRQVVFVPQFDQAVVVLAEIWSSDLQRLALRVGDEQCPNRADPWLPVIAGMIAVPRLPVPIDCDFQSLTTIRQDRRKTLLTDPRHAVARARRVPDRRMRLLHRRELDRHVVEPVEAPLVVEPRRTQPEEQDLELLPKAIPRLL